MNGIAVAATLLAAAAPSGEGARVTAQHFRELVQRRPAEACRRYLTPKARRQWDRLSQDGCDKERLSGEPDRFTYRVVDRPSARVARVAERIVHPAPCGPYEAELVNTLVHRDGRWRIARFGPSTCVEDE